MHPILSVEMLRIEHADRNARVRGARSSERPIPSRRIRRGSPSLRFGPRR
jgi:hypothetical protein